MNIELTHDHFEIIRRRYEMANSLMYSATVGLSNGVDVAHNAGQYMEGKSTMEGMERVLRVIGINVEMVNGKAVLTDQVTREVLQ